MCSTFEVRQSKNFGYLAELREINSTDVFSLRVTGKPKPKCREFKRIKFRNMRTSVAIANIGTISIFDKILRIDSVVGNRVEIVVTRQFSFSPQSFAFTQCTPNLPTIPSTMSPTHIQQSSCHTILYDTNFKCKYLH